MTDIISFKGELEFAGAKEDDKTGRTVQFRIVRSPEDVGLAHPFSTGRRRKAKMPGTRFFCSIASVQSGEVVHFGEVMLLGWSDGPGGSMVSLLLDHESALHPFIGYIRASRGAPGSRFMAALTEMSDDDVPIDQEKRQVVEEHQPTPERHGQRTSNFAAILTKDERFHDWLRERVRAGDWDEKSCDDWIKGVCRISSKRELDTVGPALDRFVNIIKKPFTDWQAEQGYYGSI